MRIKSVLRDSDILQMNPGTKERIIATANKNVDRLVNLGSLLKVMGMEFDERIQVLEVLSETELHLWFAIEGQQHVIFISDKDKPEDLELDAYKWQ